MASADDFDDRDVVVAVLAGDVEQFARLVHRYRGPLLHLATSRLHRSDLAEDVVQDTFVCVYRSLHTYKPSYSFRTWLWTILLNQCRRQGRKLAKYPIQVTGVIPEDEIVGPVSAAPAMPDVQAMVSERNELLANLLGQLPEHQADAIRLRYFGQLKYREIADATQCSLGTAKKRVRQGLETMSDLLRKARLVDSLFPGDK